MEGLDYRIGKCCSPLPGEEIIGTVSLGNHGITIHRRENWGENLDIILNTLLLMKVKQTLE